MPGRQRQRRRVAIGTAAWWAALAVTVTATPLATVVVPARPEPVNGRPVAEAAVAPDASAATTGLPESPPAAQPTALRIERIGVSTELVRLDLDGAGALQVPASPEVAGWFAAGTVPGHVGPAVVAGHVDSKRGPGVFFRLRTLRPGDKVHVDRSDGRTLVFQVTSVRTFPKDQFPTVEVYGPTPLPELRLVTCGGPFDKVGGRYLDNVIVHAVVT